MKDTRAVQVATGTRADDPRAGLRAAASPGAGRSLARCLASEAVGTALLLAAVVGSGIMGERLSGGNAAVALLANSIATGAALVALIMTFGPLSGAHLNPLVSLAEAVEGRLRRSWAAPYVGAQIAGAFAGVVLAHAMFGEPLVSPSRHVRSGAPLLLSEVVATFGLLAVTLTAPRRHPATTPIAVGCIIAAAYWFTASTSFANPAVTLARSVTDTFAGIRPADAPGFIVMQLAGAALAVALFRWLLSPKMEAS